MVPTSQKDRPITFMLFDGESFIEGQDLIIRPEELSRTEPARASVTQTLGGAWVDDFGAGLSVITLAGTTGWHGSRFADGEAQFERLRTVVVDRWHALRKQRADQAQTGEGVDAIKLVLSDRLDNFTVVVVPAQFQLRRHKSRPLLMQYNIQLTVLGDFAYDNVATSHDFVREAINNPNRYDLAIKALAEAQRKNQESSALLGVSGLGTDIMNAANKVLAMSDQVLESTKARMLKVKGIIDRETGPLIAASAAILQASRNAFQILAAGGDLTQYAKAVLQRIAGNMRDALCNLLNGFRRFLSVPDFSDIFGASTCSSTGGGRPISPWAAENPFPRVLPVEQPAVTVGAPAQSAMEALRTDVLDVLPATADVLRNMRSMGDFIRV